MVEAADALARPGIAGLGVQQVDVVVALTRNALPPRLRGVPMVTRGTLITARTCRDKQLVTMVTGRVAVTSLMTDQ